MALTGFQREVSGIEVSLPGVPLLRVSLLERSGWSPSQLLYSTVPGTERQNLGGVYLNSVRLNSVIRMSEH
jgi:hypothetical protein